jgi:hypothetical protein
MWGVQIWESIAFGYQFYVQMKSFSFCYWDKKNWREIQKTIYMTVKMVLQVMDQLVDIVYYMYQEIHDNFGPSGNNSLHIFCICLWLLQTLNPKP